MMSYMHSEGHIHVHPRICILCRCGDDPGYVAVVQKAGLGVGATVLEVTVHWDTLELAPHVTDVSPFKVSPSSCGYDLLCRCD